MAAHRRGTIDKPNMAKAYFVDKATEDAAFILERIDKRWLSQ